jgi:metal-responsive CopG/Arc/MetJ family transcriptional regulator
MAKVLISMNAALIDRVDTAAAARGLSRSAYLSELVEREIGQAQGPGSSRAAHRAMLQLDDLFLNHPAGADSTAAIRDARDSR